MSKKRRNHHGREREESSPVNKDFYQRMIDRFEKHWDEAAASFLERRSTVAATVNEGSKDKEIEALKRELENVRREATTNNRVDMATPNDLVNVTEPVNESGHYSFKDVKSALIPFTGEDQYVIAKWIEDFEETAAVSKWSELDKLFYGKRLLEGDAKALLRAVKGVDDWQKLKDFLIREFGIKHNSATIHKKMAQRKKLPSESFQRYLIELRELGMSGNLEEEAIIQYCIDGIPDAESNKQILYGANSMKEFKEKLKFYEEIYSKVGRKTQVSPQLLSRSSSSSLTVTPKGTVNRNSNFMRCFACGERGHSRKSCRNKFKNTKCFSCGELGHLKPDCPKNSKDSEVAVVAKNYECGRDLKKIFVENQEMMAMIDSGSDLNLMSMSKFDSMKDVELELVTVGFSGVGSKGLRTRGRFLTTVVVDDDEYQTVFHIVDDDILPVSVILGKDLLSGYSLDSRKCSNEEVPA